MASEHGLTLYHMPQSRSSTILWLLEEIGQPYDLKILDGKKGENRAPAYLTINPLGKVPALVHDGVVITEAAAICAYMADAFPEAGLGVPIGHPRRGPYLKWLFFGAGCLDAALMDRMLKHEPGPAAAVGYRDFDSTLDLIAKAVETGPYLLGNRFTAADLYIGSGLQWGLWTELIPLRSEIVAYTARLAERPAARRAHQKDMEIAASLA
jgi:glutathione S-transferase